MSFIRFGDIDSNALYVGASPVQFIAQGNNRLWEPNPIHAILHAGAFAFEGKDAVIDTAEIFTLASGTFNFTGEDADFDYDSILGKSTLTIASGTTSGDLTDFPVFVDLADLTSDFWDNVAADLSNLRVRNAVDDDLPFDLMSFNYGANTGQLFFLADSILAGSDNVFTIVADAGVSALPGVSDPLGQYAVWSDYEAMAWYPSGSIENRVDGSAPTTVGTVGTGTGPSDWLILNSSGHLHYDGLSLNHVFSMGARALAHNTIGSNDAVAAYTQTGTNSASRTGLLFRGTSAVSTWESIDSWLSASTGTVNDIQYSMAARYDTTVQRQVSVNGVHYTDSGISQRPPAGTDMFMVGSSDTSNTEALNGAVKYAWLRLDYVTDAWLGAEYLSWNDPSNFYSVT